jgi:hypothetical protein
MDNTAEAEVRHDLPESITGNDNTVSHERIDGAWKVADCIAPFGGSSSTSCSSPSPGERGLCGRSAEAGRAAVVEREKRPPADRVVVVLSEH